jgi:hypothetical protein
MKVSIVQLADNQLKSLKEKEKKIDEEDDIRYLAAKEEIKEYIDDKLSQNVKEAIDVLHGETLEKFMAGEKIIIEINVDKNDYEFLHQNDILITVRSKTIIEYILSSFETAFREYFDDIRIEEINLVLHQGSYDESNYAFIRMECHRR